MRQLTERYSDKRNLVWEPWILSQRKSGPGEMDPTPENILTEKKTTMLKPKDPTPEEKYAWVKGSTTEPFVRQTRPPTTTTSPTTHTVLGPDGFAAGKSRKEREGLSKDKGPCVFFIFVTTSAAKKSRGGRSCLFYSRQNEVQEEALRFSYFSHRIAAGRTHFLLSASICRDDGSVHFSRHEIAACKGTENSCLDLASSEIRSCCIFSNRCSLANRRKGRILHCCENARKTRLERSGI